MGVLSDVVDFSITTEIAKVARAGFGAALILSQTAAWADPELVREYSTHAELATDFVAGTAEYMAGQKYFGQSPRPTKLYVGKVAAARRATQRWAITPTAVNSYTYRMKVNGNAISFTADASATVTEIIAGLKAAIDALSLGITVSDQTTYMRILANTAGAFFYVETEDGNLSIVQDHADPGVATDLDLIRTASTGWYALITTHNSKALIDAAATWAQTNKILYVAQTQDTPVKSTILSGTDDVGESVRAMTPTHAATFYSKGTNDFADAAWFGRCLPFSPGTETWKFKELTLVTASVLTSTERSNLRAKRVNFYEETASQPMTEEGYAAGGQFLDLTRYIDYLTARVSERIYGNLNAAPKVPFNDKGIDSQLSEIRAQLAEDEGRGVLEPGWTVTAPKRSEISDEDKAARLLDNVELEAVYTGAVHKVKIRGVITV